MPKSMMDEVEGPPEFVLNYIVEKMRNQYPNVPHVSITEFTRWLETPGERTLAILDARPDEEFQISHIQDAMPAGYKTKTPEELLKMCEEKLADKPNATIVVYCSAGGRSCYTANELIKYFDESGQQPRPDIFNLEGCLFRWANERRPMVDGKGQPTKFVHPHSEPAGKMLEKEFWKFSEDS